MPISKVLSGSLDSGKVLQVVQGTTQTQVSMTTTYADMGLSVNITPQTSDSDILIAPSSFMSMEKASDTPDGTITYSGVIGAPYVSSLLKTIKIGSSSDNLVGQQRLVTLEVTDSGVSSVTEFNSSTVTKLVEFVDVANLEKSEFVPKFLGIFEFMRTKFVKKHRRSWQYQFFKSKPMGITENIYGLNFAPNKKNEVVSQKVKNWNIIIPEQS